MSSRPQIIKETHAGFSAYEIRDEMLTKRQIEFVGSVNEDSVNSIISQILYLNSQSEDDEITIFINSGGGEVTSGLALYDVMSAVSCPIRTVCFGMAGSMAALLFASGDRRELLPHAQVMIHDPLIMGDMSGSALSVKNRADRLMRTREITAELIAKHTGKTISEIYKFTATDTYFTAEEAIEFGLADAIITKL